MTEHRLTRIVVAVSALVVAVCAVVVTTRVMVSGLPLVVEQQKVYDSGDLTRRVNKVLSERGGLGSWSIECPSGVTMRAGVTFRCDVEVNGEARTVPVTVTDTDSGELEVGDLE